MLERNQVFCMEALFRTIFEKLIDGIVILILTGSILSYTLDLQTKAAHQKKTGLVSMLKVNQQLVGKTP